MDTFFAHKKGESYCGDRHLTIVRKGQTLYVIIDGIGHGEKASKVADIAYHTITKEVEANSPLPLIIKVCEAALANTRGIVVSFVMVTHSTSSLEYYSVGNIETMLINSDGITNLKQTPGVFGAKIHPINPSTLQYPTDSYLLMFTDGVNEITGEIRQQLNNMNSRHIVKMLSNQWQGQDDICILCEKLNYELYW